MQYLAYSIVADNLHAPPVLLARIFVLQAHLWKEWAQLRPCFAADGIVEESDVCTIVSLTYWRLKCTAACLTAGTSILIQSDIITTLISHHPV
jgi:hypothetical protein